VMTFVERIMTMEDVKPIVPRAMVLGDPRQRALYWARGPGRQALRWALVITGLVTLTCNWDTDSWRLVAALGASNLVLWDSIAHEILRRWLQLTSLQISIEDLLPERSARKNATVYDRQMSIGGLIGGISQWFERTGWMPGERKRTDYP